MQWFANSWYQVGKKYVSLKAREEKKYFKVRGEQMLDGPLVVVASGQKGWIERKE